MIASKIDAILHTRRSKLVAAFALLAGCNALCGLDHADAKGRFSHLYDSDPKGIVSEQERRALLDLYTRTRGESSWDKHNGWNGPPGSECSWYGITCNHTHVIKIELGENHLAGVLPDISGLSALDYLDLRGNQLSGSISAIGKMSSLGGVNISNNSFEGEIPALANLGALEVFYAGNNHFSGKLPTLASLAKLQYFAVDNNNLTGPVPALAGLASLESINLSNNKLSGSIPSLTGLVHLQNIEFNHNQLTGPLPALEGLIKLRSIKIEQNQISGNVPDPPSPNEMERAGSRLCPNKLTSTSNPAWDRATGSEPWYKTCAASSETRSENGGKIATSPFK